MFFGIGTLIGVCVARAEGAAFAGAVLDGAMAGALGAWAIFALFFRVFGRAGRDG